MRQAQAMMATGDVAGPEGYFGVTGTCMSTGDGWQRHGCSCQHSQALQCHSVQWLSIPHNLCEQLNYKHTMECASGHLMVHYTTISDQFRNTHHRQHAQLRRAYLWV